MFAAVVIACLGLAQQVEADVAWVATNDGDDLALFTVGSFRPLSLGTLGGADIIGGYGIIDDIDINSRLGSRDGSVVFGIGFGDGGLGFNVLPLSGGFATLNISGDTFYFDYNTDGGYRLYYTFGVIEPETMMVFDAASVASVFGANLDAGPVLVLRDGVSGDGIFVLSESAELGRTESYAGAVDYALHATRNITETVMQTTPFAAGSSTAQHDEKGNLVGSADVAGHSLQAFGGYYGLSMESDSSKSGHDYDLDSNGGYAGVRAKAGDSLSYGGFVAVDNGTVDSAGLDLDADGYVVGLFAHYAACEKVGLWANVSYGDFSFDGDRRIPNGSMTLDVEEFDADAFQIGIGADYQAYSNNGLTITPGLGLRYIDASTDSITETGGVAALEIDGIDADSLLLDFIVKLAYTPEGSQYGLSAYVGYQHDLEDGEREIDAALALGGNDYRILAPGLGDSAFLYGAAGYYDITEDLRLSGGYRGESRSDAEDTQSVDLRVTYQF